MTGAGPGCVAARETRTMPLITATKKAYTCNQPRIRGLPRSTGFRRGGARVTKPGYGTVTYLQVDESKATVILQFGRVIQPLYRLYRPAQLQDRRRDGAGRDWAVRGWAG